MMRTACLLLCCGLLQACTPQQSSAADLAGTYTAKMGGCGLRLTLDPRMGYLYEKQCPDAAGGGFSNRGRWELDPSSSDPALTLFGFKWGVTAAGQEQRGGIWSVSVVRGWFGLGQPRLCVDVQRSYCLSRQATP